MRLKPLIDTGLRRFIYLYDFGDHWEHGITVEGLVVPKAGAPAVFCTAGENACPPEDVGSSDGYAEFLEIINNPTHEDHASMWRWVGGPFDPAAFDLAEVNERLATIKV